MSGGQIRVDPQPHPQPRSHYNTLYHSHLRLSSAPGQASSPPSATAANTTTTINAMVPHIARLASDKVQVQTASTVQYHRAPHSAPSTVAITRNRSLKPRPMRHIRHPSNLPLYTSVPKQDSPKGNHRLRDSLKPLFHIFSPNSDSTSTASSSSPTTSEKTFDDSRKVGSKARVLQESSANTHHNHHHRHHDHHRKTASRGSNTSNTTTTTTTTSQNLPVSYPPERPTRYFRREQSRDAVLEELMCEGLVGGGRGSASSKAAQTKKRKGRSDDGPPPDLGKPLPALVPDEWRRTREETYWAGVADDIARRASMLS